MESHPVAVPRTAVGWRFGPTAVVTAAALVATAWLVLTPSGLLGKADAVGYAVCHRIDLRSFHLGTRALPLCARCTGMYLGALVGIVGLTALGRGRHGGFPRPALLGLMGLAAAAWAVDGLNSYLTLIPGAPHPYQPNNVLRLVTGTLLGMSLGVVVLAGFNQNAWRAWNPEPIAAFREAGILLAAAAVVVALVLSGNPLVLYPLALLSAAGVLTVLTLVYAVVAMIVSRRENRADSWSALILPATAGLGAGLLQIALLAAARLALTGTWGGFAL